jgi:hypothetical protein
VEIDFNIYRANAGDIRLGESAVSIHGRTDVDIGSIRRRSAEDNHGVRTGAGIRARVKVRAGVGAGAGAGVAR